MAEEKFVTAICRIQGFEKRDRIGYQLIAPQKEGLRNYLTGASSTGPVFDVLDQKIGLPSIEEAKKACIEEAKKRGYKYVKVVVPQKAPKFKFGHSELVRLGLPLGYVKMLAQGRRKIVVQPGYLIKKLLTGKSRGRSNAKKYLGLK